MSNSDFLSVAKQVALASGQLIESLLNNGAGLNVSYKESTASPVTQADIDSEDLILSTLTKAFPEYNVLSEEADQIVDKGSEYTLIVDPLDGTKAAKRKNRIPTYCVAIGLLHKDQPVAGVVLRVATNELYWGEVGGGAFKNGQPISVEPNSDPAQALVGAAFHNTQDERDKNLRVMDAFRKVFLDVPNEMGAIHSIMRVAEGQWDGFVHRCRPWDFAAAIPILTEAGGQVSDWQGKPLDFKQDWLEGTFSNGLIHSQIIQAMPR